MIRRLAIVVALLTVVAATCSATGETLADVLRREVPSASPPPADAQSPITSYEVLNDSARFLIGYYVADERDPKALNPPLRVLLLDKRSGSWQHREIQGKTAVDEPKNFCAGSVLGIKSAASWFFLETHVTPSASCTFVLSRTLEVKHLLFGWPVAFSSSGRAIVEGSTIHFAPTHPLKLLLYDPSTDVEIPLLPRQDDIILRNILGDLSEFVDESRCRENIAPCPEDVSGLPEKLAVNDSTNAVAVSVRYNGEGYGSKAESFHTDVVYVFDLSRKTIRYREFRPDVLKKLFGSYTLEGLTQPAALQRLFPKKTTASR